MSITFDPNGFNRRALLMGAGYSRNFGGFLAREIRYRLLSKPQVRNNPSLLKLVQMTSEKEGGFELVLQYLQGLPNATEPVVNPMYPLLDDAVYQVFMDMHDSERRKKSGGVNLGRLNEFLTWFGPPNSTGYLFTLNQDLVLEALTPQDSNLVVPGVVSPVNIRQMVDDVPASTLTAIIEKINGDVPVKGALNLIKLHGAFNWRTADGRLLILGGDKEAAMRKSPLLTAYLDLFEATLKAGDVRLFVIGYSFSDKHINKVINEAVKNHGLTLWIMDRKSLDEVREYIYTQGIKETCDAIHGYIDEFLSEIFSLADTDATPYDDRIKQFFEG